MDKNLEKLFSLVLMHWLRCSQIAQEEDGKTELGSACGFTADILRRCLETSGFDTDMKDFVSEIARKGESI